MPERVIDRLLHPHRLPAAEGERFVIVGLGNPGRQYARNRHNVGFQCVDYLGEAHGITFHRSRFKGATGEGVIAGVPVILVKPSTFMNDSGQAVGPLCHYYKVPIERVLVIYDDIDLAFGKLRVRPGGSSGGHNGIKSIIQHLGSEGFIRMRVGVGRPAQGDPVDYVLNDFDRDQAPVIARLYSTVDEIVRCVLTEGIRQAMNTYNGRSSADDLSPGAR